MNENSCLKKRILSLLVAVVVLVGSLPLYGITSIASSEQTNWYASGTGTEADPYIIKDVAGLEGLAAAVNGGANQKDKYIKLADDFDNTGVLTTPIGLVKSFYGNFDGNGKIITLDIDNTDQEYVGLFGTTSYNIIKNVIVKGSINGQRAGGIAGYTYKSTIANCASFVTISASLSAGGIAAYVENTSILNCYENATLPSLDTRGLFGCDGNSSDASTSYSTHGWSQKYNHGTDTTKWIAIEAGTMKVSYGEYYNNIKVYFFKALVDNLNAYVDADAGKNGLLKWAVSEYYNDGYPFLVSSDTSWYDNAKEGVGDTEANPYIIKNTVQLEGLAKLVNSKGINFTYKYIKLSNDFDATIPFTTPIGVSFFIKFSGNFDGNGKILTLSINGGKNCGLFGYATQGFIKNTIVNGLVKGKNCGGIVVFSIANNIYNCASLAKIIATDVSGGLICYGGSALVKDQITYSSIINCYEACELEGTTTGGAYDDGSATLTGVYGIHDFTAEGWTKFSNDDMKRSVIENTGLVLKLNYGVMISQIKGLMYWSVNPYINDGYPYLVNWDTDWYLDAKTGVGDTEENPYIIKNTADLEGLAILVNTGSASFEKKYIKLADNFDSSIALITPIGNVIPFSGNFDGNGQTIKLNFNYNINSTTDINIGLFGAVKNATIQNVNLEGKITAFTNNLTKVGGIVGFVTGDNENTIIKNCNVELVFNIDLNDKVTEFYISTGGILGLTYNKNTYINGCSFNGKAFSHCYNSENIIGGIAGVSFANIVNCFTNISVNDSYGDDLMIGGIAGANKNLIENCYANINVKAYKLIRFFTIGGISGYEVGSLINCFAYSNFDTVSKNDVGGVVGNFELDSDIPPYSAKTPVSCYYYNYDELYNGYGYVHGPQPLDLINWFTKVGPGYITRSAGSDGALVDIMNQYVKANPTKDLYKWVVSEEPAPGCLTIAPKAVSAVDKMVIGGGEISVGDKTNFTEFDTVTVTVTPYTGSALDSITVYKSDDSSTKVNFDYESMSFIMPEYPVTIVAIFYSLSASQAATGAFGDSITREITTLSGYFKMSPLEFENFLIKFIADESNKTKTDEYFKGVATSSKEAKFYAALMVMFSEYEMTNTTDTVKGACNSDVFFKQLKKIIDIFNNSEYNNINLAVQYNGIAPMITDELEKLADGKISLSNFITYLNTQKTNKPKSTKYEGLKEYIFGWLGNTDLNKYFTMDELNEAYISAIKSFKGESFSASTSTMTEAEKKQFAAKFIMIMRIELFGLLGDSNGYEELLKDYKGSKTVTDYILGLLESDVIFKADSKIIEAVETKNNMTIITTIMSLYPKVNDLICTCLGAKSSEDIIKAILTNLELDVTNESPSTSATTNNGYATVGSSFNEGEEVTITTTPSEGYEVDEIKVYKTGDADTKVAVDTNKKFIMPAYAVTVKVTFKKTNETLFNEYKAAQKLVIDAFVEDTYGIGTAAKSTIDSTNYDDKKTLDQNKAVIDAIIVKAEADLLKEKKDDFEDYKIPVMFGFLLLGDDCDNVISKATTAISTLKYDETKTLAQNIAAIDALKNAVPADLLAARKAAFAQYKADVIKEFDKLGEDCGDVIKTATEDITETVYDEAMTLAQNKAYIDTQASYVPADLLAARILVFNAYKDDESVKLDDLGLDCGDVIKNARATISGTKYDNTKTLAQNKAAIDLITEKVPADLQAARKLVFNAYREDEIAKFDDLGEDCGDVIKDATADINDLVYDETKTLADNKARVDEITAEVPADLLNARKAVFEEFKKEEIAKLEAMADFEDVLKNAIQDIKDLPYEDEATLKYNNAAITKLAKKAIADKQKAYNNSLARDAASFREEIDKATDGRISNHDKMIEMICARVGRATTNIIQGFFDRLWNKIVSMF